MRKILYTFLFIFLLNFSFVSADATSTNANPNAGGPNGNGNENSDTEEVTFHIKNENRVIFSGDVEINEEELEIVDSSNNIHSIKRNNVLGTLLFLDDKKNNFEITDILYDSSFNSFILNCVDISSEELCGNWQYVVNDNYPSVEMDDYLLKDGDVVYIYYGQPKRLILPDEIYEDVDFTIQAEEYDYKNNAWDKLSSDGVIGIFQDDPDNYLSTNIITTSTTIDGEATFNIESKGSYKAGFEDGHYDPFYEFDVLENSTSTPVVTTTDEVTFHIKNGDEVIFSGDVEINEEELEVVDNASTSHSVKRDNVLGALSFIDNEEDSFEITDLLYDSSFDSFLLNCIESNTEELCYNWQYVVNDEYPNVGIDQYTLNDDDVVYVYFGHPKRLITPDEVYEKQDFIIEAQEYFYQSNTWGEISDYTIGVLQDNPDDLWSPIVIATSTIDGNGATFNIDTPGSYKTGFEETSSFGTYYYPTFDFDVLEASSSTSTNPGSGNNNSGGNNGGSNGGSQNNSDSEFNIDKAVEYLISVQEDDGSFGANLYTDWATVGLASVGESNNNLENMVRNSSTGSNLSDLIRRSMALMSLGLDPQSDYEENLIEKILDEFDGEQFGDSDIFNDDIFTLIVLQKFGLDEGDEEISKTIDFLLTKQSSNGRWEGVDLTAAAIQALSDFENYDGVSESISDAEDYLRNRQNNNGGWDNAYSTAWAMMAMSSLGYDFDDWLGNPLEYLGDLQNQDGGLLIDDTDNNRIWSTSYAIAAASEKDWIEILESFSINSENESDSQNQNDSGDSNNSSGNGGSSGGSDDSNSSDELGSDDSDIEEAQSGNNIGLNISGRFVDNLDQILSFLDGQEQQDLAQTSELLENQEQSEDSDESESEIELVNTVEDIEDRILDSDQNNQNQSEQNDQENSSDNNSQTAAVLNALNFDWWIYLLLGIITSIISVIMFRRKI